MLRPKGVVLDGFGLCGLNPLLLFKVVEYVVKNVIFIVPTRSAASRAPLIPESRVLLLLLLLGFAKYTESRVFLVRPLTATIGIVEQISVLVSLWSILSAT